MKMTTAIFDLDGTLLNSLGDLCDSVTYAVEKHGFPPVSMEQTRIRIGNGVRKLVERSIPEESRTDEMIDICLADFRAFYGEHMMNRTHPYEGIASVLETLKENGVTVSDEEVEKAWKDACKSAGGAKAFKKTLKTYGYTEDTYKDSLKESLAQQKLKDAVAPTSKPKDSEIVDYINENLSSYNDARRSSNILIKVDSDASDEDKAAAKAKAQECLDKINSGELSFEDAVEQYSEDTGSKEKKGDVGWDKLTTFVDSYQTALEGLNKGDVSEVVESTYGYHIIKCTDYFHVDNQVDDINQVPKDIKKYVSNVVKTQAASTAYSEWLEQYKKDADITVNPMPKDVPYNVSLKGVTKSSTDDSSTTE